LSRCLRNKRFLLKKENKNGSIITTQEEITTTSITKKKIHERIREKYQDFLTNFKEFNSELQELEGQVFYEEFEVITGFKNLETELKSMFDRASKLFQVSVISKLEDDDYMQIIKLIEHKISKTDLFILKVKYINIIFNVTCLFLTK